LRETVTQTNGKFVHRRAAVIAAQFDEIAGSALELHRSFLAARVFCHLRNVRVIPDRALRSQVTLRRGRFVVTRDSTESPTIGTNDMMSGQF